MRVCYNCREERECIFENCAAGAEECKECQGEHTCAECAELSTESRSDADSSNGSESSEESGYSAYASDSEDVDSNGDIHSINELDNIDDGFVDSVNQAPGPRRPMTTSTRYSSKVLGRSILPLHLTLF